MNYFEYSFETSVREQRDMLIALLSAAGFYGFEEAETCLKAYVLPDDLDQTKLDDVLKMVNVMPSISTIKEVNWNEKWEADFEPVKVKALRSDKPFVYLRAAFHEPHAAYKYDIVVTPKMSFGTGHHATTYLMIAQMSVLNLTNKRVIDFGTGTGVLAILAEKMGAASVIAIDCDEWSIRNAKENAEANGCSKMKIIKEERIPAGENAEVILANINLNILLENMQLIAKSTRQGGAILFSGILISDKKIISEAIENAGMKLKETKEKDQWLCLYAVK